MMRIIALAFVIAASSHVATAQTTQTTPPAVAGTQLPNGPGKPILQRACNSCHTLTVITSKRATPDEWAKTVNEMVNRGADLSDDEMDQLIAYLSTNFGPVDTKTQHPASTSK